MISGKGAKFYIGREEIYSSLLFLPAVVEQRWKKKKKKRKEERIGRDGGRNERGEGGGGEETEKREGRKNSVPVQKPTKREGGREGGEKRGGEGRDWNILKDAFRLNAADEIVSCQGRREGEANGARKRSKMKIRERNSSLRKRNLFEEEVISEVTS